MAIRWTSGAASSASSTQAGLVRQRPNTWRSCLCRPATTSAAKSGPNALSPAPATASGAGDWWCIQASAAGEAIVQVMAQASAKKR